jgi:glycosyltransferase involved in cell wall biosynthesis
VTIDADLQDDPHAIEEMLQHFQEGSEIVYGVRTSRQTDGFFKRLTAIGFYKLMKYAGAETVFNHADFRLLSRRTIEQLSHFKESNLFLRGIFTLIGFKTSKVYYDRRNRALGETKYTFKKMFSLAWEGLTSFSHAPLEFILISGALSFFVSIGLALWVLGAKIFAHPVSGWASIMVPLCFIGGIQLLSIGIIGEYLAKIYLEVKSRPRYIKDTELG